MSKSDIELATEAILESIKTGYEVDCHSHTDNYGNIVKTIFLKNGEHIILSNDKLEKIYEEVWKNQYSGTS